MKPQIRAIQYLRLALITLAVIIFAASCKQSFNKQKWKAQQVDGTYPYRNGMLNSVTGNYLKGMTQSQLTGYLGKPDEQQDNGTKSRYYITREFDNNGKPRHIKNLLVKMKDKLVDEAAIEETIID